MAASDDTPATLANLWLKPRPSRARSSQAAAPAAHPPDEQMGLLFAAAAPSKTPSPRKQKTPPSVGLQRLPAASPHPEPQIYTVHSLVSGVREHLEGAYHDIWVQGEVSNLRAGPSGHLYFTLKDGDAQLPVVLFRRQAQLLRFRPQDGLAILARGRVSVYESRGQLQLIAETLEPRGAGALQLAFDQLKARLLAEGLFDASRKRPLPTFPRCIGVVTSTAGAVLHDILTVVRRRHAPLHLLIYPAVVQGPGCAASVTAGIDWFNRNPERVDLILLARGGGSLEDLAGFNEEGLARAIAASGLPVVSAIGHETDFTIADFVADLRAPTPSAAAELITAAQHSLGERVEALDNRLRRVIRYQLIVARQRLGGSSAIQMHSRIQPLLGRRGQRLDDLRHRLESAAARALRRPAALLAPLSARLQAHHPSARLMLARRRIESVEQALGRLGPAVVSTRATRLRHAAARLEALSPLAVLQRGYSLVYLQDGTPQGSLLRDASAVRPGQRIRARLAVGTLEAEVTETRPSSPSQTSLREGKANSPGE